MCGIAGLYRPGGLRSPNEDERRMQDALVSIAYRGPDASGCKRLDEHGLILGHRRLAILDLDARANQPFSSQDGRILITYNGEIYNFKELRTALSSKGASFSTECDTEVLIEGYRHWGIEGLLQRCIGMFAFALYDSQERILHLARDRAGQKPLLYALHDGGIVFASEMRALLALYPEARNLDPIGLDAYLNLKYTPSPRTLFKDVEKLPPGSRMSLTAHRPPEIRRYWDPAQRVFDLTQRPKEWLERIEQTLMQSVKRRLVSDVPVCLFLSGGVDSSLIADAVSRGGTEGLKAYSMHYGDLKEYNEREYSRIIAKRYPLEYEEVELDSEESRALLEDESLILDEPISDWIWVPLYQLSRKAHADGFKVALLGEGADEIFFGYDVMLKGLKQLQRFENPVWRAAANIGSRVLGPIYRHSTKGHRRYDLMRRVAEGEPVYMGSSLGFNRSQRHQVAGPRLLNCGDAGAGTAALAHLQARFEENAQQPDDLINRICYIEFYTKMTEVLLQRVDRVTMLHSLEARSPFLDHHLIEAAFSIRGTEKIRGGLKGLYKDYARTRLPAQIVDRPKMGFSFPFKEWLRGDLGAMVDETFSGASLFSDGWVNGEFARRLLQEHRSTRRDHAPRTWLLFSLCRWYEQWIKKGK